MSSLTFDVKPFNGDHFLLAKVAYLAGRWGIRTAIETGTFEGHTTAALADLFDDVITIEVNPRPDQRLLARISEACSIICMTGSSSELLPGILSNYQEERLFVFLDAHWESDWPLLDELDALSQLPIKPLICIHDFKVPHRPDLGFDRYRGQACNLDYVIGALKKIYGGNPNITYNHLTTPIRRGALIVEP